MTPCEGGSGHGHGDRLTGLDATLPAPRDAAARTCTSRRCWSSRATRPPYDDAVARDRGPAAPRPALPPAPGLRAARAGPARCGSTTRTSTSATTCATARCRPRAATSELARLAGRALRPAAGPLQAAVGDLARRGPRRARTASRSISKTHHALVDGVWGVDITSVLFDTSPTRRPAPRPAAPGSRAPRRRAPQLLADALVERATVPAEIARGVRAVLRAPRARRRQLAERGRRHRRDGPRRAEPRAARRPSTCRSARTAATRGSTPSSTTSRRSRTPSAARSTTPS